MADNNTEKSELAGMCIHGNFPPCKSCQGTSNSEQEKNISIHLIDPENKQDVSDYYQFEIDQGFTTVNPKTTFEKMIAFRQTQLREQKLKVAVAKEGDKIVSTGVVVLENGTLGRELESNEAGAGGVVVSQEKRNSGIGEMMARQQLQIAREAGKESIVSYIDRGNDPSFRLHLKLGYRLEGIRKNQDDSGQEKIDFKIRNQLNDESEQKNWIEEVLSGRLVIVNQIETNNPNSILIDPNNEQLIEQALTQGYRGVFLLRPKDFEGKNKDQGGLDKNYFIFSK
ncbi:MAG: GNAT family N-acetyltransferase [Candidatus Buchananbacteria bacterium]